MYHMKMDMSAIEPSPTFIPRSTRRGSRYLTYFVLETKKLSGAMRIMKVAGISEGVSRRDWFGRGVGICFCC